MVCQKCGTRQILGSEDIICPKCESMIFLPKALAIKVAQKQIDWFDNGFKQVLGRFDKRRLLVWLFGIREKMATDFFKRIPSIELRQFLSVNVLIKRVMEDYDLPGNEEANDKNTPELIDLFSVYILVSENKYLIEEDFGHYIAKEKFNLENIDKDSLMSNFKFIINEDYVPILESFEDNLIMKKESAEKFIEIHKEGYKENQKLKPNPVNRTPEETINMLFPTLQSLFGGLTKNRLYADTFNLEYLKKAGISPEFILNFIKKFEQQSGLMTQTNAKQFKRVIRTKFRDLDKNVIYNNLVMTPENREVFPFFINVDNHLLISHNFIRQMGLFYYPFFYTEFFSKAIEKRSNDFEKIHVPEKLSEIGFKVIPDYSDKKNASLQIDQIAWKDGTLYVIETKVWDLKPYFEHRRVHGHRERDLKGVVDGKKYSYIDGKERIEDIPSLLEKIRHVEENLSDICEDYSQIKEVKGIVITKSHPTIKNYKDVRFIGFRNLKDIS
ncbi:MAG: hypothetical protein ABFQ65_01565 [Nanoarchaeota archaeon]